MKSSETDILVVAGHAGASEAHWQARLIAKLKAARLVEQEDWLYGSLAKAITCLRDAVAEAKKPVVFVAHAEGCSLVAHAVSQMANQDEAYLKVKGAFLVAPPDAAALARLPGVDPLFAQVPRGPLPFPSILVASSNDPHASLEDSADLALAWGSQLVEAGEAGRIDHTSGHGPWPEGMMRFAGFLSKLKA